MTDKVPALGNVQQYPIADVRPAPDNPRIISEQAVEMVARSLTEFGWQQPLVVDADGVLIAGHTRLQAAHIDFHALEKHNNRIKVREAAAKLRAAS